MFEEREKNNPIASDLGQQSVACFAHVCLSKSVLGQNLRALRQHFLLLPQPSLAIFYFQKNPKASCVLWDTETTAKNGAKPFEVLDKSLIHTPTGLNA